MSKRILAFDFGASSGRAMLGEYKHGAISAVEIHRFSNDPVTVSGVMCWDILRLLHEIKQAIVLARSAGGFDAIGIDTWGVDFGMLTKEGELLGNPVHYRDLRTKDVPEQLFKLISKQQLYSRTGIQFMRFNTIYQLFYLVQNRPQLLQLCDKILPIPDLFAYFLTGAVRAEQTFCSTTNMLDPVTKKWDFELLEQLGIDSRLLPEIIKPCESYGMLGDDICNELMVPSVPVIAVCTHDTASAVVSAPTQCDFAYISCGTWSLFGTELDAPLINEQTAAANFTNEGGFNETTRLLKNIMGLWLIQESRRQWKRQGIDYSFAQLEQAALSASPFLCFIDPDAPEFETAGNIPQRVCDFCKRTGQHVPQDVGEIIRCIYQSLAMKYKYSFLQLQSLTGKQFSQINMLGGGIKDKLLCQMTADSTATRVVAGPVEATVMGNIAVQLIALGEIDSLAAARRIIGKSTPLAEYQPKDSAEWDMHYNEFIEIMNRG